jgi:hypothetical protein
VFVQIREFACVLSVAPAGIVPTAPPPLDGLVPGLVDTVFPLGVVLVVGVVGCVAGRGAGLVGVVRVVGVRVCGRVVVGAGAGVVVAGTSLS